MESGKSICPQSVTHGAVAAAGGAIFLLSVALVKMDRPFGDDVVKSALFIIGATAIAISLLDVFWRKVYRRPSTGLRFDRARPSLSRTLHKCAGLLGSMGLIALLYWLFPEYHGPFYDHYYQMLRILLPPWIVLAFPYFYLIDAYMWQPYDAYWHMGKFVALQWKDVDVAVLRQHVLGWLIRGFFLPLMFSYMCFDLARLLTYDFTRLNGFNAGFDFLYDALFFVDVGWGTMGYLASFRFTDTHIRSAESTVFGWFIALACYEPFWSLVSSQYLAYGTNHTWRTWLAGTPLLYGVWGCAILALVMIYVWATVIFGVRFSNLTNRGIITNGPYRWMRHPAYVSKNLTYWMISVPFIVQGSLPEALRHCLQLCAVNAIYFLRAKTEERHLSADPQYVAYAAWMEERSIFRFLRATRKGRISY